MDTCFNPYGILLCSLLAVQITDLPFEFPFYGHIINQVAIASGGMYIRTYNIIGGHALALLYGCMYTLILVAKT